jgi:hypothetical protein
MLGTELEEVGINLSKFTKLSDISNQNYSRACSGCFSSMLPEIDVPVIISNLMLLFAITLNTPQPKAPSAMAESPIAV